MKLGGQRRTGWHQSGLAEGGGRRKGWHQLSRGPLGLSPTPGPTQGLHMGSPRRREAQIGRASGGRVCGENRLNQLQGAGSAGRWHQSHGTT